MKFRNPFAPKPRAVAPEIDRVKALVRDLLALPDDSGLTISEIACRDAACGGVETVALVLPPNGETWLLRMPGPAVAVTADTLLGAALAAGVATPGAPAPAGGEVVVLRENHGT